MTGTITYRQDAIITAVQFIDVLNRSTLGARRPIHDPERIQRMLDNANILITAWHDEVLVGVSRAITDFAFSCYLSDLAVDENYQKQGIGAVLVSETQRVAGDQAMLILLAAPAAIEYYPKIGMTKFDHCFVLHRKS